MDRATLQQHIDQAERHIALGERHIARQRSLIMELTHDSHDIQAARELLTTLEDVQRTHIGRRDRLLAELALAI